MAKLKVTVKAGVLSCSQKTLMIRPEDETFEVEMIDGRGRVTTQTVKINRWRMKSETTAQAEA